MQEELALLNEKIEDLQATTDKKEVKEGVMKVQITSMDTDHSDVIADDDSLWTYQRIRGLVSQLNTAIYAYADRLSTQVTTYRKYREKFRQCSGKLEQAVHGQRNAVQDKIKLQEALDDLQSKHDALQQVYEKVKDINEDNRQLIENLRANRDRCVQTLSNRKKTIDSLRTQATELRRQIARYRARGHK